MLVNKEKLEELLLANWSKIIDARAMLSLVRDLQANYLGIDEPCQVRSSTLSRFEWTKNGFLIWIEFELDCSGIKKNGTSEVILTHTGSIIHVESELF